MNLQNLRDELSTRAASADQHAGDLLPGVRQKVRRTKQRRAFTALGVVAVLAAVTAGLVPTLTSTTPPADTPPEDFTRDGLTVPGVVGRDKLLKAWIGDRDQTELSFSWTPSTDSVVVHADCDAPGSTSMVTFKINGWYVGDAPCGAGPDSWVMSGTARLGPDAALWLASPVGKPAQVTAELVDLESRRPTTTGGRIWLGIYSTPPEPPTSNGAPARIAPAEPDAYRKDGVVYRKTVGGDTLAAAQVADPGVKELRFSFTSTGAKLVLRDFCTANARSADLDPPYSVAMRIGSGKPFVSTCHADSTDAATGSSLTVASPAPAGQPVDVFAQVVPTRASGPAVPPDVRLGLGVYFQGPQRVVDGVPFPERTEVAGYRYRLAEVKTAPGPDGRLSIDTPADQPYVVAYGGSTLGTGEFRADLKIGNTETGVGVAPGIGGLGVGWDPHGPGPADRATLTVTEGRPTKGTLILAIYLPD